MTFIINDQEKKALLEDARESISAKLEKRDPKYEREPALQKAIEEGSSALCIPCGAFVTLSSRANGKLRGCIGRMTATAPLEKTIRTLALDAAFGDPRFPPLNAGELGAIGIEISVLTPMIRCYDPSSVTVGVHGLYLSHNGRSGVLLPQVPVEQGWNRDEYLEYICVKAGLPPRSYEAPGAELYTFTAIVFGE